MQLAQLRAEPSKRAPVSTKLAKPGGSAHIPRILHQTWKTSAIPSELQRYVDSWARYNNFSGSRHGSIGPRLAAKVVGASGQPDRGSWTYMFWNDTTGIEPISDTS